jgi:hypothetical protein
MTVTEINGIITTDQVWSGAVRLTGSVRVTNGAAPKY